MNNTFEKQHIGELRSDIKRIQTIAKIARVIFYPVLVVIKKINPESEIEL